MKKYIEKLLIYIAVFVFVIPANAQQITLKEAQTAATYAMLEQYEEKERDYIIKELSVTETNTYSVKDTTFMYEVLFNNGRGILLSGNINCLPVLGHLGNAKISVFDNDAPCCLTAFLDGYVSEIRESFFYKQKNFENIEKWNSLLAGKINKSPAYEVVSPLTTSKWGQSASKDGVCPAYNYYVTKTSSLQCSKKNCSNRCPLGCAAVAMGQVMYYWKYPMQYDWCNMPDTLYSKFPPYYYTINPNYATQRNAVARLLKDAADAAKTDYCIAQCNSSATLIAARSALVNDFGYSSNATHRLRSSHILNPTKWKNFIKTDLDNGRPVIYGSIGVGDGHWWVIDGYDSDDKFHFNLGWPSMSLDGWYTLNNLNAINPHYNISQEAIFEIHPNSNDDFCNYNKTLNNTLMIPFIKRGYFTNLMIDFPDNAPYTINSGQNVEYKAHNSIIIKPGFRAAVGSKFRAYIEPCANCPNTNPPSAAPPRPNTDFEDENEDFNISNSESSISVFPNPTTGIVNIISQNTVIESISVFDVSGKVLESGSFTGNMLNLSHLSNGIYFIKIQTLSEQTTHKVIIQK